MRLSNKLILAVTLAAMIAVPALSLAVYYSASGILRQSIGKGRLVMARQVMNTIDRVLYQAYQGIQLLAEQEETQAWLERPDTEGRQEGLVPVDVVRELEEKSLLTGPWNGLSVIGSEAMVLASTDAEKIGRPLGPDSHEEVAYRAAMRGELYYSDLVLSADTGRPTVVFAAPTYSRQTMQRSIIGVVIGHFAWHVVLQIFDETDPLTQMHLLNRDGVMIGSHSEHRDRIFHESLAGQSALKAAWAAGQEGFGIYGDVHGKKQQVLTAYVLQSGYLGYQGQQWRLLAEMPLSRVYAPIYRMAQNMAILTGGILLLLAAIFFIVGRRLTRPIEMLTGSVRRLAAGDLNVRAQIGSADEVGVLAEAFNQMVSDLNQTTVSKKYVDSIVQSMADMLFVVDGDGKIRTVNRAALDQLGYAEGELIGLPLNAIMEEGKEAGSQEASTTGAFWKTAARDIERICHARSGRRVPVSLSSAVMHSAEGGIEGVVCVAKDISDRKRAEQELRMTLERLAESNAELEQFAYVAAHDLQEPLRMVASYVQLLARRYGGKLDADADDFIGFAVDGATRMQHLINDLLTYSRVTSRGKPFESVDCETVLEKTSRNLQMAIEEQGALISHDPLPQILADEVQMGQLFQNLIENAIKFHQDSPLRVHVSAEDRGSEWRFSVCDNGVGIDSQYGDRIFLIFKRLHGKEYPGTGIGLAVCKKIVERHGGLIWVQSEAGKGATFYFTIAKKGGSAHGN